MSGLEDYLKRHGLGSVQAGVWARFLGAVLTAMEAAAEKTRVPEYWTEHIAKEGALLKPRRNRTEKKRRLPSEEGLTCALAENLRSIRVHAPPDDILRTEEVQFESEARMPSKRKTGKLLRRIDVMATSLKGSEAPFIVFEAKLVVDNEDIVTSYLGDDGLGCFLLPGEPYPASHVAAVVAYTVDRTFEEWSTTIEATMADPGYDIEPGEWPAHSAIGTELLWTRVKRDLIAKPPVHVAHLVLRFDAVPVVPA